MTTQAYACSGYCTCCQTNHALPAGPAEMAAHKLIQRLDREKRLDFHNPPEAADPRFSSDYLFGEARGKMFGVMVCRQADGALVTLKAFSGQYNGAWEIRGWAPPLFNLRQWRRLNHDRERTIKKIGTRIISAATPNERVDGLKKYRRQLSRDLMREIHQLYILHNFRSQRRGLAQVYTGKNGIPNGTADCCGPKLLNAAARNHLVPLGLAEFYYGRENRQGSRRHGDFYSSCDSKCAPILGFMLCGLDVAPPMAE